MAKIKRNCDKCSNKASESYCTMRKDMSKAFERICDGFKIIPVKIKPIPKNQDVKIKHEVIAEEVGDEFYNLLKSGGSWSFAKNREGRIV